MCECVSTLLRQCVNASERQCVSRVREFFIDDLIIRIHFINAMIRWTGLAPWEFEFPFPGSLTSTFLETTFCGSRYLMGSEGGGPCVIASVSVSV